MLVSEICEKIDVPPTNKFFELSKHVRLNDILKLNPGFFVKMIDEKLFTKCFVAYDESFLSYSKSSSDATLCT